MADVIGQLKELKEEIQHYKEKEVISIHCKD